MATDISPSPRGWVWEASFADMQKDEVVLRKLQLIIAGGYNKNRLVNFYSLDLSDRMYHVTAGGETVAAVPIGVNFTRLTITVTIWPL